MSMASAQEFVGRMKVEEEFRTEVTGFADHLKLSDYLHSRGYEFDLPDLIRAMAACMAGPEPSCR
jgi:hypothetical protein